MVKVKTRKQKGGFIKAENRKAILEFLENSNIAFLNSGSYGFILIARANKGYNAKIRNLSLRNNKFGKPVKELILKLSFIDVNDASIQINSGTLDSYQLYNLLSCNEQDFIDECDITREISQKSSDHCQPICPTYLDHNIIFNNTATIDTEKPDVGLFWNNVYYLLYTKFLNNIYRIMDNLRDLKLGIMIMEYMSHDVPYNHISVSRHLKNIDSTSNSIDDKKIKKNAILIKLLSMHVELALLGYIHNDLHCNNAFYDPNNTTYYDGETGRILLLDFGKTHKLSSRSQEEQLKIKTFLDGHQYTKFLQYLYYTYNNSGHTLEQHDNELDAKYANNLLYGYMVGRFNQKDHDKDNNFKIYGEDVNSQIDKLLMAKSHQCAFLAKFLTKRITNGNNTTNNAKKLLNSMSKQKIQIINRRSRRPVKS